MSSKRSGWPPLRRCHRVGGLRRAGSRLAYRPGADRKTGWTSSAAVNLRVIRGEAPTLITDSGSYCYHSTTGVLDNPHFGGPPEWNTILPINFGGKENGQKRFFPDQAVTAPGNFFVSPKQIQELVYADLPRARDIMKWRGRPNTEDITDRRIPWLSSTLEGVVTNSFLSGEDYAGTHREVPPGYWLGDPPPLYREGCGVLTSTNALCNDWIVFVRPDPEYRFLLVGGPNARTQRGQGNFDDEHRGNIENETRAVARPRGLPARTGRPDLHDGLMDY